MLLSNIILNIIDKLDVFRPQAQPRKVGSGACAVVSALTSEQVDPA